MKPPRNIDQVELPLERADGSRRSFLKLAGFGLAATTLSACSRAPVRMVVPRLSATEGVTPGRPYWMSTTCGGCEARCGVVARARDGRPVKLEGNPDHALSRGGLCAVGQASILELYDSKRMTAPTIDGADATWDAIDERVRGAVSAASGRVALLTPTLTSPSTRAWAARFVKEASGRHVEYDPLGASALLDAHDAAFGVRAVPHMHLDRAEVIVAFDADFLGAWLSPVEQAKDYAAGRRPDADPPRMSRHVQFEAHLSLTGGAADERIVIAPWEQRGVLAALCTQLGELSGKPLPIDLDAGSVPESAADRVAGLAAELWAARGKAVVLCGTDDLSTQALTILANQLLGAYGTCLDLAAPSLVRRGSDADLSKLIADMASGSIDVLIVHDVDPVHDVPAAVADAIGKVGLVIATAPIDDATAVLAGVRAPVPHTLASWDDAEPVRGHLSLAQPVIPPVRKTRTLRGSLAAWLGQGATERQLVRAHWQSAVHGRSGSSEPFARFFESALRTGYVRAEKGLSTAQPRFKPTALQALAAKASAAAPPSGKLAAVLYANVALRDGRHAHNAYLQETPDPVTKLTWDNCASLSPKAAADRGLADGDVVSVSAEGGAAAELPVRVQVGLHDGIVGLPLGYGKHGTERFADVGPQWFEGHPTVAPGKQVGCRVAHLASFGDSGRTPAAVGLSATGARVALASTQDHHSLDVPAHLAPHGGERRDAAREVSLDRWKAEGAGALPHPHVPDRTLWDDDHPVGDTRWSLAIDLSACIGCSGCVVACQVENNVPVVGRDEVERHREMTWLRIDRYFSEKPTGLQVLNQPMLCQHCGNAPCETVCPVLATAHSEDGLNQQVYNRCVGTRYCANNCPYKVRRFNWFNYERGDDLARLALNPDVSIRSRGVMEKCSMCVQRIQESKAEASRRGEDVADGAIKTACQQSCPTDAIAFGNAVDPESALSVTARTGRAYTVLPELRLDTGVTYLARVRNAPDTEGEPRHG